nr:ScbR family autoregulator-binding transcription factor [Streptomyces sp. SID5468]
MVEVAVARLRQERAVRTREKIVLAAASVFEERGFARASISEILARAGVTKGALYFHFPSKEALAQGVMAAQGDALELPGGTAGLQNLIDLTLYLAGALQRDPLFRAGVRLAVEQAAFGMRDTTPYQLWIEAFGVQLVAAKERGEMWPHVEPERIARLLVGAYSGIQLLSKFYTDRADLPERVAEMWRCLLPGIAVPGMVAHLRIDEPLAALSSVPEGGLRPAPVPAGGEPVS